jgi:hypothetical protein
MHPIYIKTAAVTIIKNTPNINSIKKPSVGYGTGAWS